MGAEVLPHRGELARQLSLPDEDVNLGLTALLIACDEYPDVDVTCYQGRISLYAQRVRSRLRGRHSFYDAIYAINAVLFEEEGFRGNAEEYYDPRNSYLNEVIDRKTGIPITLSILFMEVGRRTGHKFRPIGAAGHFLVCAGQGPSEIFIDPYNRGALLSRREAVGVATRGKEKGGEPLSWLARRHLPVLERRAVVRRMLNNLKGVHRKHGSTQRALRVAECIRLAEPDDWRNLSDLARLQTELGRFSDAAESLTAFIEQAPEGVGIVLAENALRQLRALVSAGEAKARPE